MVIPTWVYAILWRSSFVYTSSLIRRSPNSAPHGTPDYQSHSAWPYKQRKTPTSEHSGVITPGTLILAPPRGDEVYCCRRDIRRLVTTIKYRHREELYLRAVVIPTWVYAILWRSSFVYTSALIRRSPNSAPHGTHDYQSHSARPYKQRKTPTSEHSGVITLRTLILAPPRGDEVYCCRRDIRRLVTTIKYRHREELHLLAVVIPTWVYAILWRSSFVYTSALIRRSPNSAPHGTHDYQSHSARPYK